MLTDSFISLCKEFAAADSNVLDQHVEDSKKVCNYIIEFYSHFVEFRYVKKESTYFKPSSLYCVIGLKKNSVVYYHLPDILPYLNEKSFKACYFSNIENPERLRSCFENLTKHIECVASQLEFSGDDSTFREKLFENYKMVYSLKDADLDFSKIEDDDDYAQRFFLNLQRYRDGFLFSRFSNFAPYAALVKQQTSKAIIKYKNLNSKGKLFDYEKQLLHHIKAVSDEEFSVFDSSCDTSNLVEKFATATNVIKAFLLVFTLSSIVFCGFCACYNGILWRNASVVLSEQWHIGFWCAALCSIFGCITYFPYMSNKHLNKKERKEFLSILISKSVKVFSKTMFIFSLFVSLFFAVMIMKSNVRFYEDHLKFDSKVYTYDQIHCVYHIDARYNSYDERLDRASFVILFDDETSLDLDGYTSIEYAEEHLLPLLREKHIEIREADSERDLPWYSE